MANHMLADQLLIYMSLAEGTSKIVIDNPFKQSNHFKAGIEIIKKFIPELKYTLTAMDQ